MIAHTILPLIRAALLVSMGCSAGEKKLQEEALHKHAVDLCKTMRHQMGASCTEEVERNFARCAPPFLAKTASSEGFSDCLGFASITPAPAPVAPTSTVLGKCNPPNIVARVSLSIAKSAPWPGSTLRKVNELSLYVSNHPTVTTRDLQSLQLEEQGGTRTVSVELSAEAAKRFETATRTHLGEFMVLDLNGSAIAPKIASAIPGPKLVLIAAGVSLSDVCRTSE